MPAVTVEDVTTLARIPKPGPQAVDRPVRSVTTAPSGYEGEGFPVRRAFAGVDLRDLDPFVHMDQMGEVEYAPGEPKGTAWHPHGGSRPSPTSSTASSSTPTPTAAAARSPTGTPSG
jgi:quercetin 2,3-dioxygenase